jgi:hypothetical protein
MASILKLIKNPKAYAAKKLQSAAKTAKAQPFSLASGLLGVAANVADSHYKWQQSKGQGGLSPRANVLNALSGGAQLWANAKGAERAKDDKQKVAEIIGDNSLSDDDKYARLLQLGSFKQAESIKQRGQFGAAMAHKKAQFGETQKQNNIGNIHWDKEYAQKGVFHNDTVQQHRADSESQAERAEAQNNNNLAAAIVGAIGKIGSKNGMTKEQLLDLLNNNGKIEGIEVHGGKIGGKDMFPHRTVIHGAQEMTPKEVEALKKWKREHGYKQ